MSSRLAKYFEGIEAAPPAIVVAQESNGSTGAEEITHTPSAESLAAAKEFMAARSGVEDVGVAEQQLATVISGVGGFKSALEALNEKGGVSQEAAPLFEKAVNVYVTSVGLEAISLGFKYDEFNEQNPRQMASFEELDNVSAMFATATTQLETERTNAEKRLTNAAINFSPEVVSTESFGEVTTEITAARETTQNEIKQAIVTSIQPLRQAMTDGNAAGGFGMESLLAISLGVEAFTQLLNRDPIELLGGVEGLNPEGLNQVGMEELDAVCAEVVVVDDGVVLDAGLDTTGNAPTAEVPVSDPVKPEAAPAPEVSEGEAPEVFDNEGPLSEADVLELLTENDQPEQEEVSQESNTVVLSMEANIKDLKSGRKVKFSHGHGKIVKMFTAPFKYGHKEHHASKDEPRFLVKADKGGHYSIHKASALTLV